MLHRKTSGSNIDLIILNKKLAVTLFFNVNLGFIEILKNQFFCRS